MIAALAPVLPVGVPHLVRIAGDFTSTTVAASRDPFERAIAAIETGAAAANTLRVDRSGARIIDSVGLNVLIGVIKRVREARGVVVLAVATASARRILTFARLDRVVRIEGGA